MKIQLMHFRLKHILRNSWFTHLEKRCIFLRKITSTLLYWHDRWRGVRKFDLVFTLGSALALFSNSLTTLSLPWRLETCNALTPSLLHILADKVTVSLTDFCEKSINNQCPMSLTLDSKSVWNTKKKREQPVRVKAWKI